VIDPFIGKTIGKYKIVAHLGHGATADVYKAFQETLDRHVAIKLLHPFLADDADFLTRFQREAKAIARLRHPNIVQVYDFDVIERIYYLVMEFVDGYTLKTKLQELAATRLVMPLDEAIRIARCVAMALSYAHGRDMVHRDIKPANIIIDQENQVILTDFGMAKILGSAQFTASGDTIGTPAYASPEQVLAQPGDPRSDVYSLGAVFFHMVTGQVPYDAETGVAVFLKHLTEPLPSPRQINPALSPDVERIIFKAMAKKPERRYQTADELIEDLDRIKDGLPVVDAIPSPLATTVMNLTGPIAEVSASAPTLPEPGAAQVHAFQLPPYTLSPGHAVDDPYDLPAACDADWDRAVTHFIKGYISTWLREGVTRLRTAHQHGVADDLEVIADRAEAIIRRIPPNDEVARNAALEEFLVSLGATPPLLDVTPARLDLPALGVGEIGQPVALTIANRGRGYLFGQVVSYLPWLEPIHDWFGCVAGGQCTVTLQPDLTGAPAGRIDVADGISIRSMGGDKTLPVQIDVLPAVLEVDVPTVDFGAVGQGKIVETTLAVRNGGRGFLTGSVESLAPWLRASSHKQFRLPAGESIQIALEADSEALRPGRSTLDEALVVDTNAGRVILGAHIRVQPPRLKLEPEQIDLGVIDLIQPRAGKAAEIRIHNHGLGVLIGVLKSDAEWLTVEPAAFRCRSGQAQPARLTTGKLRAGDYHQVVRVISNAGDVELPVRLRVVFSLEPERVRIPSGEFLRGSPGREGETAVSGVAGVPETVFHRAFQMEPRERGRMAPISEQPQRQVYLSEYEIGKYPVTNAQYAIFVAAVGRRPPAHWAGGSPSPGQENHPVVNVSWNDAVAYCLWLADITGKPYRLPTEAQWEKAARGADGRVYPWGSKFEKHRCNTLEQGVRNTMPVGAYSPAGDSPYGCADMAGNVWEWVSDWYAEDYYAQSTAFHDPYGPAKGHVKVMRGGSCNTGAWQARAASRSYANRSHAAPEVGFRCAVSQSS
jgi:serine/threonine-protein kinase